MQIFNIGALEFIIIVVLMFIMLGPKDMIKTMQSIGKWVRGITQSPMWREVWGISQDIRELPKRLMEDTGLEEALAEVQKTTQEVTDELNTQIKEAKEAATVTELQHLTIDPTKPLPPPAHSTPADLPDMPGVLSVAQKAEPAAELTAPEAESPTTVEVAASAPEAPETAERKPRRKKLAVEPDASQVEPVKKPRRKKLAAEDALLDGVAIEAAASEAVATEAAPVDAVEVAELAVSQVEAIEAENIISADAAIAEEQPVPTSTESAVSIAMAVETPKVRKPRQKKQVVMESAVAEPANNAPEAALPLETEPVAPPAPEKIRKPRQKKQIDAAPLEAEIDAAVTEIAASEPVEPALAVPPQKRRPRARKTADEASDMRRDSQVDASSSTPADGMEQVALTAGAPATPAAAAVSDNAPTPGNGAAPARTRNKRPAPQKDAGADTQEEARSEEAQPAKQTGADAN